MYDIISAAHVEETPKGASKSDLGILRSKM